jgi:hypothetical protein
VRARIRNVARGTTFLSLLTLLARLEPRGPAHSNTGDAHALVNLDLARERLRAGQCYRCGGEVADGLARLGSILCHDCRDASPLPSR